MTGTAAALFDVDGTLLDTTYLHIMAWWQALRRADCAVSTAKIHRSMGMGADRLLAHLLGEDRDHDQDEAISTAHDAFYAQFADLIAPCDGAAELLRACAARGWTVVLASSASGLELDALRSRLDAEDVIAAATSSDDVGATKPAPDVVVRALKKVNGSAEHSTQLAGRHLPGRHPNSLIRRFPPAGIGYPLYEGKPVRGRSRRVHQGVRPDPAAPARVGDRVRLRLSGRWHQRPALGLGQGR